MSRSIVCRDCRTSFPAPARKGRPPVKCDDCRNKVAAPKSNTSASDRLEKARAARFTIDRPKAKNTKPSKDHNPVGIQAQCTRCYRVFSSDSLCEEHKYYSLPKSKDCKDPKSLGLTAVDHHGIPLWIRPNDN